MIPELDEIGAIDVDFTPPKPRANKKRIQPHAVSINTSIGESDEMNDTQPIIVTPVNPESDTKIVAGPYKEHKRYEEHDSFYVQGEGWISRNEDEIADAKESIAN